jgi:hypothetical protein
LPSQGVKRHDIKEAARRTVDKPRAVREKLRNNCQESLNITAGIHHDVDKMKIELRKAKFRLEGELQRLKEEKGSLSQAQDSLEKELNSEIERATRKIDCRQKLCIFNSGFWRYLGRE